MSSVSPGALNIIRVMYSGALVLKHKFNLIIKKKLESIQLRKILHGNDVTLQRCQSDERKELLQVDRD